MNISIPFDVRVIMNLLTDNGYQAYIVGGCVRDSILGRIPKDWDITTNAKPNEIKTIFSHNSDFEVLTIGEKFGMIAVLYNGVQYEITTYRIDGTYDDCRHPKNIKFTSYIVKDLSRRDFTMNAIAYNDEKGIVDPFNGYNDIQNKIIRCVGKAEDRFNEDKLRILRAIRFEAQLSDFGMKLNDEIVKYIKEEAGTHYLLNVSDERINAELCKILLSKEMGAKVIRKYKEVFFQPNFLGILEGLDGLAQNNQYHIYDVFEHTLHAMSSLDKVKAIINHYNRYPEFDFIFKNDIVTRLAILFHDSGKMYTHSKDEDGVGHFYKHARISEEIAEEYLTYLKFSNKTISEVCQLIRYHELGIPESEKSWKKLLNKMSEQQSKRWLVVKCMDKFGQNPKFALGVLELNESLQFLYKVLKEKQCFKLKDLNINGNDLINLGFKEGKKIGNTLNELLNSVIDGNIENTKEKLEFAATNILAKGIENKWYTELTFNSQFTGKEQHFVVLNELTDNSIKAAFVKNGLPYNNDCHWSAKLYNKENLTIREFFSKYPHLQINEWFYDDKNRTNQNKSVPTVVMIMHNFDYVWVCDNGNITAKLVIFIKEKTNE